MALKQNSGFDAGDEEGQPVPHGGGDGATSGNDLVHGDGQSTRDWAFGSRPRPQRSRSRENAMKHGAYARTVPVIRAGPLKEDEEEVRAFYEGVVAEFKPGDSTILQAMAWDIASLQWSQVRLRKWEADGYSLSEDQVDVYQPDRNAYFAREREKAADVLERLGDPELASGDLRPALIALIQVTEVDRNLISTVESLRGRNQLLSVLLGFIRDHYRDTERAIQQLDLEAARHRNLDWDRRVWDSFGAARTEAVSEFTRSLQDARARISRELDRAITRYQLTREALKRLE